MKKVIAVVGPTASGKTALAVEIAIEVNGEIICADSMQVYRDMPVATAAVTQEEKKGVTHHLTEFLSPGESFSVARFVELASPCIDDIISRGKVPVIAGGTGLFIDSLLNGVSFVGEAGSKETRRRLEAMHNEKGADALYTLLKSVDEEWAQRVDKNNVKRVIRALQVYYDTGVTMSEHFNNSRVAHGEYEPCRIGINYRDRNVLYERINRRVDLMLENGLLEEAERCLDMKLDTAAQAIGHKEAAKYFSGEETLEEAVSRLKQSTRNYAKRQLTWFRKNKSIYWVYPDENKDFVNEAKRVAKTFLKGE